jgi:hypothetical protein
MMREGKAAIEDNHLWRPDARSEKLESRNAYYGVLAYHSEDLIGDRSVAAANYCVSDSLGSDEASFCSNRSRSHSKLPRYDPQ